jgi:L-asparaginase
MKHKIAVVFTGGTISMKVDPRINAAIPALTNDEILSMITNIERYAEIEVVNFSRLPSPHITPEIMFSLAQTVKEQLERPEITGVVVTHGTDTLEETAYFLDLVLPPEKPIVIVGAMRSGSELGYDGPSNLAAAICTAISPNSKNNGVLVVMNNEVNAAREVTKTNTLALNTFRSPEFGPLGIVDNDEVIYYRNLEPHDHYPLARLEDRIALFKATTGDNADFIDHAVERGYRGIIIEALGRGNVPPDMAKGIYRALDQNVPVVIVSRCPTGRVLDTYGYEGAGKMLHDRGAIFGYNLPGQKARIKLMVALSITDDPDRIRAIFEDQVY